MWSLATEVAFYFVLPLLMLSRSAAGGWHRAASVRRAGGAVGDQRVVAAGRFRRGFRADNGHVNEWLPAYLTGSRRHRAGAGASSFTSTAGLLTRACVRLAGGEPGRLLVIALGLLLVAGTSVAGPTTARARDARPRR